jgi:hypothetical protein
MYGPEGTDTKHITYRVYSEYVLHIFTGADTRQITYRVYSEYVLHIFTGADSRENQQLNTAASQCTASIICTPRGGGSPPPGRFGRGGISAA